MTGKEIIVPTSSGDIEGLFEDSQYVFKGVPYAAPPVGDLRWLPPQPVKPWDGIRPAKEFGPIAPQNRTLLGESLAYLAVDEPYSEDCLYLNIWTPGIDDARRPVMVWIHGGAFIIGSGSQKMFRGNTLVKNCDVVLVTINYRLGCLGFMNLNELTGGKIPASGCEGLLDQIAAIEWVRRNIRNFGGDPENVTVFGESAGAMSIGCLMGMPAASGKFEKAILESGAANTVGSLEESVAASKKLIEILNLKPGDIEGLRSADVGQLLAAQENLGYMMLLKDGRITPFQPVVDGSVLPEIPLEAIRKGSAAGIKTLAGTNLEEFKLFNMMTPNFQRTDEAGLVRKVQGWVPSQHVARVIEAYRKGRQERGESATAAEILTSIQTDLMFRIPVLNLVDAQTKNGQPAYNYMFTWKSPILHGVLGSCHALEIGFVFGNYDESFCGTGPDAAALSGAMQDAWASFARTGNPSCSSTGPWKPYGTDRDTMILDKECRGGKALYERERSIWDAFGMVFTKPI